MHELSIAGAILDVVERHARGRRVSSVEVKVGHLRQVVPSALDFAFDLVAHGTAAEGADLVMVEMPATVRCNACRSESTLTGFPPVCPGCGSPDVEVEGGDELLVEALEIEDGQLVGSGG